LNGTISFEAFVETEISCCAPRFPLILTANFHSLYVKESESAVGNFGKVGVGVGNFGKVGVGVGASDSATLPQIVAKHDFVTLKFKQTTFPITSSIFT